MRILALNLVHSLQDWVPHDRWLLTGCVVAGWSDVEVFAATEVD